MKLAESAPRTKDGEYEIVFTPGLYDNHEFHLRSGFEGRRLWELAKILGSERERDFAERHPQFLFEYDCVHDPEGIFRSVSVPYIGRISYHRKVSKPGFSEEDSPSEGDSLVPPFFSVFYTPEFMAKHIEDGTIGEIEERELRFEDRSLVYLWPDSSNAIMNPQIGASYFEKWAELYNEFPEMRRFSDNDERRRVLHTHNELRSRRPTLSEIKSDKKLIDGLENLALYHVLDSLAGASTFQGNFALCQRAPMDTFRNGPGQERAYTSPELTKRLADSAVALCKEYLAEMK